MDKSKFEAAAEKVQSKLQPGTGPQALDIGSMVEIGVMLIELFSKCMDMNNGNAGQVAANVKNPGILQRFVLRRALRQHLGRQYGQRGDKLERALLAAASESTEEELFDLATETQDPTYY